MKNKKAVILCLGPWSSVGATRQVGGHVGEGQCGRGFDLFFKFIFMNTERRAVSSIHARAQIASTLASSRLARPDTKSPTPCIPETPIARFKGTREGKAHPRNGPSHAISNEQKTFLIILPKDPGQ